MKITQDMLDLWNSKIPLPDTTSGNSYIPAKTAFHRHDSFFGYNITNLYKSLQYNKQTISLIRMKNRSDRCFLLDTKHGLNNANTKRSFSIGLKFLFQDALGVGSSFKLSNTDVLELPDGSDAFKIIMVLKDIPLNEIFTPERSFICDFYNHILNFKLFMQGRNFQDLKNIFCC